MIAFEDYARHDGLGLGELVRRREVSPLELLEAAVARIEAHNPALNAVVRTRYERARSELAGVDPAAPFAGVPFLIKDLVATLDSELVRRWRAAGLVALGRTNTPEFGLTPYIEPTLYGATRNPWSLEHSPGGSSGGSAAAVAARFVPLASGGDGGGSIRIPASCCGLFGPKPSRGTTPTGPAFGELWRGLAIEHVIGRSVRDSAALLDATAGADPGAPYAAPARVRPYLDEVARDPGRLCGSPSARRRCSAGGCTPTACRDCRQSARLLESLGHDVEESSPRVDGAACARAFVTILAGEVRADIDAMSALLGRRMRAADFEPATYALGLLGRSFSAADYAGAARTLQLAARGVAPFFARCDVLLTPTLGAPPARIGSLQPTTAERALMRLVNTLDAGGLLRALGLVQPMADKTFEYIPFTALFNVTGQPAMSVPLHWNADGLLVGMQFVSRLGEEGTLLRLAGQLERRQPWFDRVPAL